ncbi:cobalamin-independent methionine synthase II family protein [Nesterenkonia massiliensis]|uniref:Cobalamin-independent methionine synthase II family protein n=1 Tax=Nesterenkonia massiliensis TaxID=1232429 RepID=A0ABT2HTC8_9MICC|nr:cobalamin-independent methionine synthase II family protein [Nesterenkonia massiliensis]MCT1607945.1 cobalamin-independent methionine synthase II family protein [Nesterenkonia massiliensis]
MPDSLNGLPLSQDPDQQILVTHAGSLPRTDELIEANAARELEDDGFTLKKTEEFDRLLREAVVDLVKKQAEAGVTLPGDGEYGKAMSSAVDYGAWWSYVFQRVGGLEVNGEDLFSWPHQESSPGNIKLTNMLNRRDWVKFKQFYTSLELQTGKQATAFPATTGPLTWRGQEAIETDIANLKAGLDAVGLEKGFITSIAPGSGARVPNSYYKTEEEHIYAWADVLKNEYKAITDAGLILQLDDPSLAENWDQISPEPSVEDYRKFTQIRIEAINYALEGIDPDLVRLHICWGSWHGPHTTDIEFRHIADLCLEANAKYFTFEAGNVRHEHEYTVWDDLKLPEGKVIAPGVVSHATNVVEHPELVAQRLLRFAERVGKENVQASTDCGLGGRLHPDIGFAKLESLAQGAALATKTLWG